ncbi:MAG TPA: MBL fold metallo-hydrolase [Chthoniobacteraceae bacterium]|jgi:Cft2 family RNA processing exonuclease|nr:MBL fold metallo-hydrolase [Chthoniobacteraceae bacterium]
MPSITFTNLTRAIEIGANSYALEIGDRRLVLDSGLHPKLDGEPALPDFRLIEDDSVEAIVLSHAHHDHLGSLPVLMRRQPRAQVFMTEATRQLSDIMLHNSVNVMLRKREEGIPEYPLFTHREADVSAKRWRPIPLHQRFDLSGERLRPDEAAEISLEFFDAGHILGSVGTLIRAGDRTIFYTGDVNFDNQTLMQAARFPEEPVDVLIMETTRGDHETAADFSRAAEEARLAAAIREAFARGGGVMMPLFALGKTQELLAMFFEFRSRGWLKQETPIYIGGLGAKLTEVHDKLAHHAPRQRHNLQLLDAVAPFVAAGQQAHSLPFKPGRIYALSSGMMTEKTLSNSFARHMLSGDKNLLIFVGYADAESPAGRIRAAQPGELVQLSPEYAPQPLNCAIERFHFSGHATRESLRTYVNKVRPKKVVLVHGDPGSVEWFRESLAADLPASEIIAPLPGAPIAL